MSAMVPEAQRNDWDEIQLTARRTAQNKGEPGEGSRSFASMNIEHSRHMPTSLADILTE